MAIKNTRKVISENASENRLKNALREGYKRSITEAGEEEEETTDDLELGDDLDMGDEGFDDAPQDDMDLDDMDDQDIASPLDDLNDTETEQVNAWIDELLGDSISQVEVDGAESLDTEIPADDIDPMGSQQLVHDDLPMSVDDLQNIIDSDDSLSALENELADLAVDQDEEGEGYVETMDNDPLADELDDNESMTEAEDPMKGIDKYFDKGFNGKDTKDPLEEDVDLADDNREIGMTQVTAPLSDKVKQTVTPTPGARTRENIEADQKGVVTESVKKSKMLVVASEIINKQRKAIEEGKKNIAKLKLENYKLIKANGLLSVAGDMLSKEARTQISESFDKCGSLDQVNKFYNKVTEKLKNAQRPSLNQVSGSRKTKINVIKEAVNGTEKKETISREQMRKNMLMGLPTNDDVYFS